MRRTDIRRDSEPKSPQLFKDPDQKAHLEARNGLRQFDELVKLVDKATDEGHFKLRPSIVQSFQRIAIKDIYTCAGNYRTHPVSIKGTEHQPPDWREVPGLVEEMCDYVKANWSTALPIHLSAYLMWRINWIHPFSGGNGRTSRAVSYQMGMIGNAVLESNTYYYFFSTTAQTLAGTLALTAAFLVLRIQHFSSQIYSHMNALAVGDSASRGVKEMFARGDPMAIVDHFRNSPPYKDNPDALRATDRALVNSMEDFYDRRARLLGDIKGTLLFTVAVIAAALSAFALAPLALSAPLLALLLIVVVLLAGISALACQARLVIRGLHEDSAKAKR